MSSLGIYFGPKVISVVETIGKKLSINAQLMQSTVATGELGEKVPTELKTIEIVALFKDELRRNKINAKEATFCLSGKDLIIRNFEIPVLPREEIASAISFEAKKYIPFKIEELIFDYQLELDKVNKKNQVLFMGIKKEVLERYLSIAKELNIRVSGVEYSAFSLIRSLGLSGISTKGIVGIVCADLKGDDEINFTVLEDGFPVFSRDISLAGGPDEFSRGAEAQSGMVMEKLKTEIRVSLDYYHRKFAAKSIQKLFLISNPEHRTELETSVMDSGLSAQFLDLSKYFGKPVQFDSNFIKGFTASLSSAIRSNIKLNLLAARTKKQAGPAKAGLHIDAGSLFKGFKVSPLAIFLGVVIIAAVIIYGQTQTKPLQEELSQVIGKQVKVESVGPGASLDEMVAVDSNFKARLKELDDLTKKQLYLTRPLDVIPREIPEGVWLTGFTFKKDKGAAELALKGLAGLGDGDKELEAVNRFIANLKENANFSKYFVNIKLVVIEQVEKEGSNMTEFSISCKTN
jgi:type IV pilus assembly protein PilM